MKYRLLVARNRLRGTFGFRSNRPIQRYQTNRTPRRHARAHRKLAAPRVAQKLKRAENRQFWVVVTENPIRTQIMPLPACSGREAHTPLRGR